MSFTPPFWIVWREDGGTPTKKHKTFSKARDEAQRLARAIPGAHFIVMAAAVGFQKRDLDETRFDLMHTTVSILDDDDDTPF